MTESEKPRKGRVAVGYLRGRGEGVTRDASETIAELRERFQQARIELDQLEEQAVAIERALEAVGQTLERAQPPMWHRVLLRWWKLQSGGPREPVFVREERSGGQASVKPTLFKPGARLRKDSGFGLCADIAAEAVRRGTGLLTVRREVMDQLAEIRRCMIRGSKRRDSLVPEVATRMAELRAEAVERLRDVGYTLPGEAEGQRDRE